MIPIVKPALGEAEAEAAKQAVLSGWVTQGPRVKEFEKSFADAVGSDFACAVSNCTAALHLALLAVGVKPGDVVITVSHTFIAVANAIRQCGAEPFFVDVDLQTGNIDVNLLSELLEQGALRDGSLWLESAFVSGRVAAVLPVHQAGMPCDIAKVVEVAHKANLPVVEDAACAVGSEVKVGGNWQRVGKPQGDIACFSFHPRKILTTGDGGMITTNNGGHDKRLRSLRQHGMSIADSVRHDSKEVIFEEYVETAFNYRMTDIQAAVGVEQLKKLGPIVSRRRELADRYASELASYVEVPSEPEYARSNWQSYTIRLKSGSQQKPVMQALLAKEISSRRGIMCCHLERPYREQWKNAELQNSEKIMNTGIILPLYDSMTESDQDRVIAAIKTAV